MTDVNSKSKNDEGKAEKIARVECTSCGEMVNAYRTKGGRILVATSGAAVLGSAGALVGSGIGLVTAGWGSAATYYLGAGAAALGGSVGFIAGDKIDDPHCPECKQPIDLGF